MFFTTLLNTATVPFLGFAFFTMGALKPVRNWSAITPQQADPNDPKSDAQLYQALQPQLEKELAKIARTDSLFGAEAGKFYLLKNEKMIILL